MNIQSSEIYFADLSITSNNLDLQVASSRVIFQNTPTRLTLTIPLHMDGRKIPASDVPNVQFNTYLSDNLTTYIPTFLNGGVDLKLSNTVRYEPVSLDVIKSELSHTQTYILTAEAVVEVSGALCSEQNMVICVQLKAMATLTPSYRERNEFNDFACLNVSHLMNCTDSKYYNIITIITVLKSFETNS